MNVLTVSVHPDDETLGCGGTLLKHLADGDAVHWLLVTSAQEPVFGAETIKRQGEQVARVGEAYGFSGVSWLKLPSTRLETLPLGDIVESIRTVVEEVRPEVVYLPGPYDVHSDHRVVFEAACAVTKAFNMRRYGISRVLACQTLSETDAAPQLPGQVFIPNVSVDISDFMERKLEIMQLYKTELQEEPMPRSLSAIRAQARFHGATVGVSYAEVFMLVRELVC